MEDYVRRPDSAFSWKITEQREVDDTQAARLDLVSQTWREHTWKHGMLVVRPSNVRNPDIAFLLISGDGDPAKSFGLLKTLATSAGAVAAVITRIPNQPLYDGRREDALIAYTFNQFMETGDANWPLLFPMVKGAVRGLDAVQAFVQQETGQKIERFVVSGASKRGWTSWLTAVADKRVVAIAPMVFDMLNMKSQLDWAERAYGKQSEKIHDYTELRMHERVDEPRMVELRSWVDPYSYRRQYTLPKLLLLGTNDPYWVVDALRHYWDELPDPKLVYQTPNAGHDLGGGKEAMNTLAAFFEMIADRKPLPRLSWEFRGGKLDPTSVEVNANQSVNAARLWTADSTDRDFRNDKWQSRPLTVEGGSAVAHATITAPAEGLRAGLVEVELQSPRGRAYKLSTEARVTPDRFPGDKPDLANARPPKDDADLHYWLENMIWHHQFTLDEIQAATGLDGEAIRGALKRFDISAATRPKRATDAPLLVLPYPGGRHPRIGFLDGAVNPQRETKLSVFAPWDDSGYVVVDLPEAIWSNLGLTYLAHTHVPTIWTKQGVELDKLEWNRRRDGSYDLERTLPNGIAFGAKAIPSRDGVRMEMWLRNGTDKPLSDLRVQQCVMLKEAKRFNAQGNDNKVLAKPFAACRSDDGKRWIISAWEPCHRPWANPPVPCLHSDPKFPDLKPGETGRLRGWLSFYEGDDVQAEFRRIAANGWLSGEK